MNKREAMLGLLDESAEPGYIPAAFFLHFDAQYHRGQPAVDKHLAYFRHTGMDFVKIQYEHGFPHRPEIQRPSDWGRMPLYKEDFYQDQLDVIEGLVKAAKRDALVLVTLYSPFMCAGHTTGGQVMITEHIKQDPHAVKKGMEIITESLMIFVKACIRLGVDGFYASTQGGEGHRFEDAALFTECVKPYDLTIWREIDSACTFNILHICDYHGGYDDLTPFLDYPGQVVNCGRTLGAQELTAKDISRMFGRPYMGGMDRFGVIVSGTHGEIKGTVRDVLSQAPDRFILGADCTLPSDIDWDNIRAAIATAHEYDRGA